MKKSGDWGLKMIIFVTAFLEAEIPRLSDQREAPKMYKIQM